MRAHAWLPFVRFLESLIPELRRNHGKERNQRTHVKIDTQSRKYRHMSNLEVEFCEHVLKMARGVILDLQSGPEP